MSIESKLTQLGSIKADIRSAITDMTGSDAGDDMRVFAAKIRSIPSSSGTSDADGIYSGTVTTGLMPPSGVTRIRAFIAKGMPGTRLIVIPPTVTDVDRDAFTDSDIVDVRFTGSYKADVKAMAGYPFGLPDGAVVLCLDGPFTVGEEAPPDDPPSDDVITPSGDSSGALDTATIQQRIDEAAPGGTVTLGAGEFFVNATLTVHDGVTLTGQGMAETYVTQKSNTRVVEVSGDSTVSRMTVRGGRVTTAYQHGAGIYVNGGTVSWCTVTENIVEAKGTYGAGVCLSSGTVDHSVIRANIIRYGVTGAGRGAGIGVYLADDSGGPIAIDTCLVTENLMDAESRGAGIGMNLRMSAHPVTVRHTTVVANLTSVTSASSAGSAVAVSADYNGMLSMTNCLIGQGTPAGGFSPVYVSSDSRSTADHCLFRDEASAIGTNSVIGDPQFVNREGGDYRITASSPARGAGIADPGSADDLDGRAFGNPPSIGCYEFDGTVTPPDDPDAPPSDYRGLCFTANEDGSSVKLSPFGASADQYADPPVLDVSMNGGPWQRHPTWSTLTLSRGDKVYFRSAVPAGGMGVLNAAGNIISRYAKFVMTGSIAASGNIMSLLDPTMTRTDVPSWCFFELFDGCTSLTSAPELPATTLSTCCYASMFFGCTSLTASPALPALHAAESCYWGMFDGCTSLSEVGAISAVSADYQAMYEMFSGCTALVHPPELHLTSLSDSCCSYMFSGCTALVRAPDLMATPLATGCYQHMFIGCTALSSVKVGFTTFPVDLSTYPTLRWLADVASRGVFYKPSAMTEALRRNESNVPVGWVVLDYDGGSAPGEGYTGLRFTASEPSSVELASRGSPAELSLLYSVNGTDWAAWDRSAVQLSAGDTMFLRAGTENQTVSSNNTDYYQFVMTGSIAASGNIMSLLDPTMTRTDVPSYCFQSLFTSCAALTSAPELPATELGVACYQGMFYACTALTRAPFLPATKASNLAYMLMFGGGTPVALIEARLEADEDGHVPGAVITNWVASPASVGTFRGSASLIAAANGSAIALGLPSAWTLETLPS